MDDYKYSESSLRVLFENDATTYDRMGMRLAMKKEKDKTTPMAKAMILCFLIKSKVRPDEYFIDQKLCDGMSMEEIHAIFEVCKKFAPMAPTFDDIFDEFKQVLLSPTTRCHILEWICMDEVAWLAAAQIKEVFVGPTADFPSFPGKVLPNIDGCPMVFVDESGHIMCEEAKTHELPLHKFKSALRKYKGLPDQNGQCIRFDMMDSVSVDRILRFINHGIDVNELKTDLYSAFRLFVPALEVEYRELITYCEIFLLSQRLSQTRRTRMFQNIRNDPSVYAPILKHFDALLIL